MAQGSSADPLRVAWRSGELKGISYELFMLGVSVVSILNMILVIVPVFDGPVEQVALAVDAIITPIFLLDFLYRLFTVRSRAHYFVRRWGWADLLSAVPGLGIFRLARIARVVEMLRRTEREELARELYVERARVTFFTTMFLVLLVIEIAGMAVYFVEVPDAEANITSAADAVWWGLVTITTVGYGDRYPVTTAGRIVGTVLLFAGIALFSVLTGFIANQFLSPRSRRVERARQRLTGTERQIAELRELLFEQEERAAAIHLRLDELERTIRDEAAGRPATRLDGTTGPGEPRPGTPAG
jgi:voltage-gated potassium channel